MITRVSRHSGYINVMNEDGSNHNVVSNEAVLLGWGRESYSIRWGNVAKVYAPDGSEVSSFHVDPSWQDLHWDGAHLTLVRETMLLTLDRNGRQVDIRPL